MRNSTDSRRYERKFFFDTLVDRIPDPPSSIPDRESPLPNPVIRGSTIGDTGLAIADRGLGIQLTGVAMNRNPSSTLLTTESPIPQPRPPSRKPHHRIPGFRASTLELPY